MWYAIYQVKLLNRYNKVKSKQREKRNFTKINKNIQKQTKIKNGKKEIKIKQVLDEYYQIRLIVMLQQISKHMELTRSAVAVHISANNKGS